MRDGGYECKAEAKPWLDCRIVHWYKRGEIKITKNSRPSLSVLVALADIIHRVSIATITLIILLLVMHVK